MGFAVLEAPGSRLVCAAVCEVMKGSAPAVRSPFGGRGFIWACGDKAWGILPYGKPSERRTTARHASLGAFWGGVV